MSQKQEGYANETANVIRVKHVIVYEQDSKLKVLLYACCSIIEIVLFIIYTAANVWI